MRHIWQTAAFSALFLIAELPVAGQYPGQYPGGGYPPGTYPGRYPTTGPRLPIPRRGKQKKDDKATQPQTQELKGVLRQIDEKSLIITSSDARTITAKRSEKTKFYSKGEEAAATALKPGDHIRIDATQDEEGFFYALSVYVDSEGSASERAAASQSAAPSTQASENDEDRPVLRRQDSQRAKTNEPAAEPPKAAPTTTPSVERKVEAAPADDEDSGPPRIKRGKPKPRKPVQAQAPDGNKSAPPAPATTPRKPEPATVASANQSEWKTDPSYITATSEDPKIAKAREAVASATESLPNYFCQEQIARSASTSRPADWRPIDVVSATVVFDNGRDEYRNLTINGKPVKKAMEELSGAWSTGEFGMMAADLFSPGTAADFRSAGTARIAGRDAWVFDFEVEREHSHWRVQAPSQSIQPAYKGSVWLDKETARVLRIETQAFRVPKEFPLDKVESAVDYDFVRIGEHQFLLPVHAETLTCVRGTPNCSRNIIDFRNYHKYTGESTITFEK